MANNRGKAWERKFKEDWEKTFPNGTIDRLYDPMGGYIAVTNISDFIGYVFPNIFYLECKSIEGNTFPFANLKQFDKLFRRVGYKGVRTGVIIWFIDHDKVIYAPIKTIAQMKNEGKKSINARKDLGNYRLFEVPGVKKRLFIDCDYTFMTQLEDGD